MAEYTETQQELPGVSEFKFRISGGEFVELRAGQDDKLIGMLIDNAPFLQRKKDDDKETANIAGTRARQSIQYGRPRKNPAVYVEFYAEAMRLNPSSFSSNVSQKRELLKSYFPRRFGDKGSQSILDYSDSRLGSLFYKLTQSAAKYVPER